MRLYLDTELNGRDGELVSLALAAVDGVHFYQVMPLPAVWDSWAAKHVAPALNKEPIAVEEFRFRLKTYLQARSGCTIYADWPADFVHLLQLMIGPGDVWMVDCRMVLVTESEPEPEVPHNALADAIALMAWHQARP